MPSFPNQHRGLACFHWWRAGEGSKGHVAGGESQNSSIFLLVHQSEIKTNRALRWDVKTPDPIPTSICGIVLRHMYWDCSGDMVQARWRNSNFKDSVSEKRKIGSCVMEVEQSTSYLVGRWKNWETEELYNSIFLIQGFKKGGKELAFGKILGHVLNRGRRSRRDRGEKNHLLFHVLFKKLRS